MAAERWYGYGCWDAPYWFVGKEPGGADDPEQYASWLRLGGDELIDCRKHDIDCAKPGSAMLWHGEHARLQPTWRPLIALLLAYKGAQSYDLEAVRRYQNESWGRASGETALVELSAVAAPSTAQPEALRLAHLPMRISTIQTRIAANRPKFVVFYGGGLDPIRGRPYIEQWSEIAGVQLAPNELKTREGVAYVAAPHSTAHGIETSFWTDLGSRLAAATS